MTLKRHIEEIINKKFPLKGFLLTSHKSLQDVTHGEEGSFVRRIIPLYFLFNNHIDRIMNKLKNAKDSSETIFLRSLLEELSKDINNKFENIKENYLSTFHTIPLPLLEMIKNHIYQNNIISKKHLSLAIPHNEKEQQELAEYIKKVQKTIKEENELEEEKKQYYKDMALNIQRKSKKST